MNMTIKCRVCLNGDRRMYAINTTVLQEIWEKLTSATFDSNDGRPVLACYICCAQLRKSHQLKERALKAEALLTDFINNGFEQSQERISMIASLSYDLKCNYVFEPFICYESEILKNSVKQIKKENEDDKEEDEEYTRVEIKEEKEDYSDARHGEYPDLLEDESNIHSDVRAPLRNFIVQTQIEVPITFEKTDTDAPMRKRKAEVVPQADSESNVYERIRERKLSNNIKVPDDNFEGFDENITGNVHTAGRIGQNVISTLSSADFRNIASVSNPAQIISIVENFKEENDMIARENDADQSLWKNVELTDPSNALDNIKEESELDTVDSRKVAEKNLLCHICKCKFGSKGKLIAHIRTHTGEKPYKCEFCDYRCPRKDYLQRHMKSRHTNDKDFSCNMCQTKFVRRDALNVHMRTHTDEKPYKCKLCDCRFSIIRNLNKHIKSKHANEKYYSCHLCQSKFTRNSILNIHLRTHTGEKPYICDLCDYRCVRKCNLVEHIKTKHTKEKNYSCHICQCKYVSRGKLNVHLRKHTGEKPYACEFCDHRFSQKSNLKQHIKFIHTEEKNFSCHICQRQFVRQDHLNRHFRQHTGEKPYTCDMCDSKFSEKSHLTSHLKYIHAKVKNYTCHICQNKFARKGTLDTHLRIHTGEKPYMCGMCDYVFAQRCSLNAHIKAHHPD